VLKTTCDPSSSSQTACSYQGGPTRKLPYLSPDSIPCGLVPSSRFQKNLRNKYHLREGWRTVVVPIRVRRGGRFAVEGGRDRQRGGLGQLGRIAWEVTVGEGERAQACTAEERSGREGEGGSKEDIRTTERYRGRDTIWQQAATCGGAGGGRGKEGGSTRKRSARTL